ncbi:cell division protein FtsQ/DivIB [Raoultibacter phocaeensis]|uniref:cell division protein FtsQ/DivIB n=1 Tax=Raoultibacter phocaeensis TaxID=2479841 RepID=UPI0011197738|nr:FtsQ-type POTRA domain-containing protein [Raoultibacter phocaeensis]
MASNYNRKSASSGSRRKPAARSGSARSYPNGRNQSRPQRSQPAPNRSAGRSRQGKGYGAPASGRQVTSVRIGDIGQAERAQRAQRTYRRYIIRVVAVIALIGALFVGGVTVYNSNLFTITNVQVTGVEHLTATEMTELASVPAGTTLLRVDAGGIQQRLLRDAWVKEASVNRVFPDTLELAITERTIAAVVSVPVDSAQNTEDWAIASDGTWLMAIPEAGSEASKTISQNVYEDAAEVLHISDVPLGVSPEVGAHCTDANVVNALDIVNGLTTDLADQVKSVKATETASTVLTLENGIEIAFGEAGTTEEIRTKERVILKLMEENPGTISYINVRVVDRPTWRSL